MRIDLIVKDIADKYTRENFLRLSRFLESQQILDGYWKFYELDFQTGGEKDFKHNLGFIPKDVIILSVIGDYNFYFEYSKFTEKNIYISVSGPCRIRFLLGSFNKGVAVGKNADYVMVPPTIGAGGTNQWHNGSGPPASGLGVVNDFYLDTSNGNVYLKSGVWTYVGNIQNPIPSVAISATKLVKDYTAGENILVGEPVYAISGTDVKVAKADGTQSEATVLGFALNNASTSTTVSVALFGALTDASFSVFTTVNAPLFLDTLGTISDAKRTSGYHTEIGRYLGGNDIWVNVQPPVKL